MDNKTLLKLIQIAVKEFPKQIALHKKRAAHEKKMKKNMEPAINKHLKELKKQQKKEKSHPWRLCPGGEHWVRTHPLKVPVSAKNPSGVTERHGHCASNPSGKDYLYEDEMEEIAKNNFPKLKGPPAADDLGYKNGNDYDELIRGWVNYWNSVFKPKTPLDPDLVKALIASESSFNKNAHIKNKNIKNAKGLMQIIDQTQRVLKDPKGELKDHLVHVDQNKLFDPVKNIGAGTRWLFRKKEILDAKNGKDNSWFDVIRNYKALVKNTGNEKEIMDKLQRKYERLKKYGAKKQ
jgi:hypothetical protein